MEPKFAIEIRYKTNSNWVRCQLFPGEYNAEDTIHIIRAMEILGEGDYYRSVPVEEIDKFDKVGF